MVALRRLDAFQKTRSDLKSQSATGGIITLVAASAAGILFIGQIVLYVFGNTTHSLSLSRSTSIPLVPLEQSKLYHKVMNQAGRIPLKVHITFPHVPCDYLDVVHDGASMSSGDLEKFHGKHSLVFRKPTKAEFTKVFGKQANSANQQSGCTVTGQLRPQVVAGVLAISLSRRGWAMATQTISMGMGGLADPRHQTKNMLQQYNVSHYIHKVEFGTSFAKQANKPLEGVRHMIDNEFYGIAVVQTQVKLVPTIHQGFLLSEYAYQTSVVDVTIQPQTLVAQGVQQLPGLVVSYDFTPLTVHHSEGRDNFLVFLSSLISIVGGVFVTVGMLTGCLVHSAQEIAKKMD